MIDTWNLEKNSSVKCRYSSTNSPLIWDCIYSYKVLNFKIGKQATFKIFFNFAFSFCKMNPVRTYLFKVNDERTRIFCEIC